jgi:Ca-activated chloride channel family protein
MWKAAPSASVDAAAYAVVAQEGEVVHDTERYDHVDENPFLDPRQHPLSTFAVDVDTASYANVRRFLNDGVLPPAGAVRIEELVNYFDYDYPEPGHGGPFSVNAEVGPCPWRPEHRLVRIGIRGKDVPLQATPPRNLVFLLDVSGSMRSPRKIGIVKGAMKMLVQQLRGEDRVAIVVYAGAAGLVLPSTAGSEQRAVLDAIGRLEAGGSTNGGAGIRLAYGVAREQFRPGGVNRVILATDGDFNVGTTSESELVDLIEEEREHGVFLTVLGVGTGNLNDSTMEKLADRGNGNYAYLDSLSEARKVLVEEVGGTLVTIAKDVKVQVEPNPANVQAYRLIGYENRVMAAEDFDDDTKDAGEIGAGHTVTALYEIVPHGVPTPAGSTPPLRYRTDRARTSSHGHELLHVKLRYKEPRGDESRLRSFLLLDDPSMAMSPSADYRFAASVAAFGMLLRNSPHRGDASFDLARELAAGALGDDRGGYRSEFVRLVDIARGLSTP